MTQYFLLALNAVVPFIFYMAFGYVVVHGFKMTDSDFLTRLNKLVFKCFFPVLMFNNFSKMDFSGGVKGGFILFTAAAVLLLISLLVLTMGFFVKENARKGVVIQAIFRSNAILFALPLAESVFGDEGILAASLLTAIVVPLYNISAVIVLEYYSGQKPSVKKLLKGIITNPLIMGAIAGTIFLLLKIQLPTCVAKPVNAIADMTTPVSLFILGGTLKLSSFRKDLKVISISMGLKLIVIPAIALVAMLPFAFTPAQRFVVFAVFATPVAVSSFTMAANMGGDADLAGEFVAVSTIASLFTLFVWIVFLKSMGIV